jgi:hypothetical protein
MEDLDKQDVYQALQGCIYACLTFNKPLPAWFFSLERNAFHN